jgi:toxin CptA
LFVLGILAGIAVIESELPGGISMPLAIAAFAYGSWLTRRELRRPARSLVIPANQSAATVDGHPVSDLQLQWRGPLAFLQWRDGDGRCRRLQAWPDSLAPAARRELRLAMANRLPLRAPRSVAP